jgi:hypothetical protein
MMPSKQPEVVTVRLNASEVRALLTVARPNEGAGAVLKRLLLEAARAQGQQS